MSSSAFAVHCCEFFRPPISAVNCLAYDKKSKRIALSRADSSIEIWTMTEMPPCRERTFPYIDNASVEALAWCKGRLFATGLDGFLREWSPNALWPVNQIKITPSAAWCMTSNRAQTHLTVGTEAGAVLLVSVSPENVHVEKYLSRGGDRIISIAWSPDGRTIVTGSVGDMRVWDVLSGRCLSRMTVAQGQADMKNLIWTVAVTKDPVIVAGDSRGVTSFWDYQTSTLINSYESHKADVLAVCWSQDRKLVFSSGIDPAICQYHSTEEEITNKRQILGDASSSTWVSTADIRLQYVEHIRLNLHTHDVRCLVAAEEWLVSGGVDGVLTFSKYPPKVVHKCYPFVSDTVSVGSSGKILLLQYPEYLDMWRLGSTMAEVSKDDDGKLLPLSTEPTKLAQIKCRSDRRILCNAVDAGGRVVAYSDGKQTLLFQIKIEDEDGNESVIIQPITCLNATPIPAGTALRFASSSRLLVTGENGQIYKLEIDDVICQLHTIVQYGSFIRKLTCCQKKQYAAVASMENTVAIIDHEQCMVIKELSRIESLIVDLKFDLSGSLLILCADGRLLHLDEDALNDAESNFSTIASCEGVFNTAPVGLTLSPTGKTIVYGGDKMVLDPKSKSRKNKDEKNGTSSDRLRHICAVEGLEDGSLVIVRIDPDQYLADLPPSLWVKHYGTG